MDEATFDDADGVRVGFRRWKPSSPTGIVLLLHGASEHGGRYERIATALADDGWAVYAIDHRGHGLTARSTGRGIMGPGGFDGLLDDIDHLRQLAVDEVGDLPVAVLGHSMGSLIALGYVARAGRGLVGCILSGSPGVASEGMADMAVAIRQAADAGMSDVAMEAMLSPFNQPFEPARTQFDWLSRDEAEVDKFIADPDCGEDLLLTYGFVAELMNVAAAATERDSIAAMPTDLPFLLVTGERDPVSNDAAQVRALEQVLRDTDHEVTARYYADARHEVLNETNRDEVHADIVGWLKARR
ncbi:MAG: alpha/beta hydrolase [Acidimicrobiales bacterium]